MLSLGSCEAVGIGRRCGVAPRDAESESQSAGCPDVPPNETDVFADFSQRRVRPGLVCCGWPAPTEQLQR
jgi:hypothetical protein